MFSLGLRKRKCYRSYEKREFVSVRYFFTARNFLMLRALWAGARSWRGSYDLFCQNISSPFGHWANETSKDLFADMLVDRLALWQEITVDDTPDTEYQIRPVSFQTNSYINICIEHTRDSLGVTVCARACFWLSPSLFLSVSFWDSRGPNDKID